MKRSLYLLMLATGVALTSCQSPAQKEAAAEDKMQDAKKDMRDAKREELNKDYPAFKSDAEKEIAANDQRIAQLREKLAKPGKAPLDDARQRRINELEKRNADLKAELYGYEQERSDWETFKAKYNHDRDNVRDAFKDADDDMKK